MGNALPVQLVVDIEGCVMAHAALVLLEGGGGLQKKTLWVKSMELRGIGYQPLAFDVPIRSCTQMPAETAL